MVVVCSLAHAAATSTICVAIKNVVRVFTWLPTPGTLKFAREHALETDIVSMMWIGSNLCIGFASCSYMVLDPIPGIVIQDIKVRWTWQLAIVDDWATHGPWP